MKFEWSKVPAETNKLGRSFDYCGTLNSKDEKGVYQRKYASLAIVVTENGLIVSGSIARLQPHKRSADQIDVQDLCKKKGFELVDPASNLIVSTPQNAPRPPRLASRTGANWALSRWPRTN